MTSDDSSKTGSLETPIGVIVLAAGRGTRMKSRTPKVLHNIAGRSMLDHVITAADGLKPCEIVVVTDPATASGAVTSYDITLAIQKLPFGTADAVAVGVEALSQPDGGVLILNGDVPLIRTADLQLLVDRHFQCEAKLTLATFTADVTSRYGRIQRRGERVVRIVEAADDSRGESGTMEANGGIYLFDVAWLRDNIGKVPVSQGGEYYLTALAGMLARESGDEPVIATVELGEAVLIGVDDRVRLAEAESTMQRRILRGHMQAGVTIVDPARTVIEAGVQIEADARIDPGCFLRGRTVIRAGAVIGPYSVIENATVGADATVMQSWVTEAAIGDRVRVGPFSRIRPGTEIDPDVHIGNFVETKATRIGSGSHVHHFSYLGDATLGSNVNVGAGTITCNYDGVHKHRTTIGDDVFVGCDTMLVAPVELGDGSKTGAGAVVTRSVPAGNTVVGVPARQLERRADRNLREEHGR